MECCRSIPLPLYDTPRPLEGGGKTRKQVGRIATLSIEASIALRHFRPKTESSVEPGFLPPSTIEMETLIQSVLSACLKSSISPSLSVLECVECAICGDMFCPAGIYSAVSPLCSVGFFPGNWAEYCKPQ